MKQSYLFRAIETYPCNLINRLAALRNQFQLQVSRTIFRVGEHVSWYGVAEHFSRRSCDLWQASENNRRKRFLLANIKEREPLKKTKHVRLVKRTRFKRKPFRKVNAQRTGKSKHLRAVSKTHVLAHL